MENLILIYLKGQEVKPDFLSIIILILVSIILGHISGERSQCLRLGMEYSYEFGNCVYVKEN